MPEQMKRWKVEIAVAQSWVTDGFDLTEENLKDAIMARLLAYSYEHEVQVRILEVIEDKSVEAAQPGSMNTT